MSKVVVCGIDLSQTGLGLVAVPGDWGGDWSLLPSARIGRDLPKHAGFWEHITRLDYVCSEAVKWLQEQSCSHIWIEGYPIGGRVFNLHMEAEIGGALKVAIRRTLRVSADTAPMSTARKLILGKLPRAGVKKILHQVIDSLGCPRSWSGDEKDAFVAANWGWSLIGGGYCIVAPQVPS
jgi:hypothetical protein